MKITLAATLKALGTIAGKTETQASALLEFVKRRKLITAPKFTLAVRAAYLANGWHAKQGRPALDAKGTAVPRAVRQYVHEIRAALLAKIDLAKCATFYELRKAMATHKAQKSMRVTAKAPGLEGITLSSPATMTGALFHDLAVVYAAMPDSERAILQKSLARLLATYSAKPAPFLRRLPSDSTERIAA